MKPRIRKHLTIVPLTNSVSIGGTPRTAINIEDSDGKVRKLLLLCNGKNSLEKITEKLKKIYSDISMNEVEGYIEQLFAVPYIMEDASLYDNCSSRDSRNLNFLSNFDIDGKSKEQFLSKIQNSTILILGLGGAGSNFALNMVSWGVKKIIGVDFDKVELSNLNRQLLYNEKDIGTYKIDAAKKHIKSINHSINWIGVNKKISSFEDIDDLINYYKCDYLFCSADTPTLKILQWCNKACYKNNIPWSYTGMGEYITTFQSIIPHISSCYRCYELYLFDEKIRYEKYSQYLTGIYVSENDCIFANSSLAASYLTFDVIKILGQLPNCDILSINKRVNIDHITNNNNNISIPISYKCEYCNGI